MGVQTAGDIVRTGALVLDDAHMAKMREVAKAVYEDRSLLADFERDPEGTANRINGFVVPEGYHIHIADSENRLYPPEEPGIFGAEERDAWDRIEFRVGYKTFSFVECN